MKQHTFIVAGEQAGTRIDKFLVLCFKEAEGGISRTLLQECIDRGLVSSGGRVFTRPHDKVRAGDTIAVSIPEKEKRSLEAEDIPIDVVYEDDELAVIDKPCGLVVHPAPGNARHTLVQALMHRFVSLSDVSPDRPGIVHRIDKETSGLLVIARTNAAHLSLAEQFARHSIKRIYAALVEGEVAFDEDVIEASLGRHSLKREQMVVRYDAGAKYARTRYRTVKRSKQASLLELEPFTGRTHQLRVHCAFIGHPILGDAKYGSKSSFPRLALHARLLGFIHPRSQKYVEFSTDIPSEFLALFGKREAPKRRGDHVPN